MSRYRFSSTANGSCHAMFHLDNWDPRFNFEGSRFDFTEEETTFIQQRPRDFRQSDDDVEYVLKHLTYGVSRESEAQYLLHRFMKPPRQGYHHHTLVRCRNDFRIHGMVDLHLPQEFDDALDGIGVLSYSTGLMHRTCLFGNGYKPYPTWSSTLHDLVVGFGSSEEADSFCEVIGDANRVKRI